MTLSEFVSSFPRSERKKIRLSIARELGISETYVRSMCNGIKNIPAKYAIRIEQITNGAVSKHVTAPMYYPLENINKD